MQVNLRFLFHVFGPRRHELRHQRARQSAVDSLGAVLMHCTLCRDMTLHFQNAAKADSTIPEQQSQTINSLNYNSDKRTS